MKIALSIPGANGIPVQIDSGLPVPTGGLATGQNIIFTFITLTIVIAILVSLWFVLKGGWDIIISKGHKEAIQKGRERVIWALMGLIYVFLSLIIMSAFSALFRYDLLCILLKPLSSSCKL